MCGITGFVNGGGQEADLQILGRMTETLTHRGPDGEGAYREGPVALGHRRLAIIDLAGGAQPMSNEDGSVWVTYNGELYNELELRSWLIKKGHTYRTSSDTESLVHLYEELGADFVRELNGMFALAIWDRNRQRLLLARDRMGQKPLLYALIPGQGLAFASEPKALLQHPGVSRSLDAHGLAQYLFYEYIPAPGSIWKGISKLPASHVLLWESGQIRLSRYWQPPAPLPASSSLEVAAQDFWTCFRSAVARHRRSDVPIGVFLSGGIDSSSVAAALAELQPAREVHTFSIGFEDKSFDESPYFEMTARLLGTTHHQRTFSAQTVLDLLPEVAGWLDEPFGDASILPTHLLSRFARERVTVALGGDGADELLAGYPTFVAEPLARLVQHAPHMLTGLVRALANQLPVNHRNFSLDFKIKQFLKGAGESPPLAHQRWLGSFSGAEIRALMCDPPTEYVEAEHLERASRFDPYSGPLTRSLLLYQDTYLPEDILSKVDRASMACGLEVRAPFLDAELVDLMEQMPPEFKLHHRRTKHILREAVRQKLPPEVLSRSKKGFGIPVARWLQGPLRGLLDQLLAPDRLRKQGLFRPEVVSRLVGEHRRSVRDHRKPLWTLLMFQLWYDRWLDPGSHPDQ